MSILKRTVLFTLLLEVLDEGGLDCFEHFGGFAADGGAVDRFDGDAKRACGMDYDFVRGHKLGEGIVALLGFVAELFGKGEESAARRAGEHHIIKWMGNNRAVLKNRHIGMCTFGDNIAAVENCLLTTGSVCGGCGKAGGNEVERFAVAIIKALILVCNNINRGICIADRARCKRYPKV